MKGRLQVTSCATVRHGYRLLVGLTRSFSFSGCAWLLRPYNRMDYAHLVLCGIIAQINAQHFVYNEIASMPWLDTIMDKYLHYSTTGRLLRW